MPRYTCLMRKIIGNLFMAIDGVVESPENWSLSYWNDDIADVVMGGMQGADALLLAGSVRGIRRGLARPYGRGRSRCGLHANVKKYVVSRTLTNLSRV
jgi:hypothetical protein